MFLRLWNYMRGYVIIKVWGFSVERFVNLAVHKGILIWDMSYTENFVTMKVSVKGFKMLKSCAKKTKCKIKIVNKMGYPFVAHRYRKRKMFVFGFLFFIFFLYFLSSFIWLIEVEGNERVQTDQILQFCKGDGFYVGSLKFKVNNKELEETLLENFKDFSWVNIEIKGTKAKLEIKEIIPKAPLIDRKTPCDVIAKYDGIITSIVTSSGTPLVKQKDVVQKGDVLVSGQIVIKEDETGVVKQYTHADAEVMAKVWNEIEYAVPMTYDEKVFTGNTKKDYSLIFLDKNINLYKPSISFANYDKMINKNQLCVSGNFALPISFVTEEYKEFTKEPKTRNPEEANVLAETILDNRIKREFDKNIEIKDKSMETVVENENVRVHAIVTTNERIDENIAVPITNDVILEDGTNDDKPNTLQ